MTDPFFLFFLRIMQTIEEPTKRPRGRPCRRERGTDLLSVNEVRMRLGVSHATITAWISAGRLPAVLVGARPKVSVSACEAMIRPLPTVEQFGRTIDQPPACTRPGMGSEGEKVSAVFGGLAAELDGRPAAGLVGPPSGGKPLGQCAVTR